MEQNNDQPFQLKNMYSRDFLKEVSREIMVVWPQFDTAAFMEKVFDQTWENLELKQRIRHISNALRIVLPYDYRAGLGVIVKTVEAMVMKTGDRLSFEWSIFPDFVEANGTDDPDASLSALETITRLSSAEFAIRPYLIRYPSLTHQYMDQWSKHSSPMVRRLASEGFRPRLPWGMGVPYLKKDPSLILPILERLKNDPAETVRRSVANNLNDISKDHPELVLSHAARWLGQTEETDWVVRHACRGLLKKGDPQALALFGFKHGVEGVRIEGFRVDEGVSIGGVLEFECTVLNDSPDSISLRLEYAITYLTSTGKTSNKVFKIKEWDMDPNSNIKIEKYQRFQDFTTRKHFPGTHTIEIVVNGSPMANQQFQVTKK